jgi:hypothetical protein
METFENKSHHAENASMRELDELRDMLSELCAHGPYLESFDVLEDGRIALDHRPTDSVPPLLPNLLASELGNGDVEMFYRVAQDIQRKLPAFEFAISENVERTRLTCRISKRP